MFDLATHENCGRRGGILVIAVGLSVLLMILSLSFFVRMRNEAASSNLVVRDVQARIMLHAANSYIMEAARLGYAQGDPLDHAGFERYGQATFIDYWSGKQGDLPDPESEEAYDTTDLENANRFTPSDEVLEYMGAWMPTATGTTTFNRQNWVGWYTPKHRGFSLTPFHFQSMDVHSWWDSWRQDLEKWEPRMRSRNTTLHPNIDPNPNSAGDLVVLGDEVYFDGARAELTEFWPLPNQPGSRPRLFQMYVREQTPYAVIPHLSHYPQADAEADGVYGQMKSHEYRPGPFPDPRFSAGGIWTAPITDGNYRRFVDEYSRFQGMKSLNRLRGNVTNQPIHVDPHLLHYPIDEDLSSLFEEPNWGSGGLGLRPVELPAGPPDPIELWHGRSHALDWKTAADGTIERDGRGYARLTWKLDDNGRPVRQDAPRRNSSNLGWFRIYREAHNRFIVTVGGGPSQGWRIRVDDNGDEYIERSGVDVDNDSGQPPPFATVDALRVAIESETRLWYRVVWHPAARQSRTDRWDHQTSYMGGSLPLIYRLTEEQVAELEARGLDW